MGLLSKLGGWVCWFVLNPRTERAFRFVSMIPLVCYMTYGDVFYPSFQYLAIIIYSIVSALMPPFGGAMALIWLLLAAFSMCIAIIMSVWQFPALYAEGSISSTASDVCMAVVWIAFLGFFSVFKLGPLASLNIISIFVIVYGSELCIYDSWMLVKNGLSLTFSMTDLSLIVNSIYTTISDTFPPKLATVITDILKLINKDIIYIMNHGDGIQNITIPLPSNVTNVDPSLWPLIGVPLTLSLNNVTGLTASLPGGHWIIHLAIWGQRDFGVIWNLISWCMIACAFAFASLLVPPIRFMRSLLRTGQVSLIKTLRLRLFKLAHQMDLISSTQQGLPPPIHEPASATPQEQQEIEQLINMPATQFQQMVTSTIDNLAPPLLISFFEHLLFSPLGVCTFPVAPKILKELRVLAIHVYVFEDFNGRFFEQEMLDGALENTINDPIPEDQIAVPQDRRRNSLINLLFIRTPQPSDVDTINASEHQSFAPQRQDYTQSRHKNSRASRAFTAIGRSNKPRGPTIERQLSPVDQDEKGQFFDIFLKEIVSHSLRLMCSIQTAVSLKPSIKQGGSQEEVLSQQIVILKHEIQKLEQYRNHFIQAVGTEVFKKLCLTAYQTDIHGGSPRMDAAQFQPFDISTWCLQFYLTFCLSPLQLGKVALSQLELQAHRSYKQFGLAIVGFCFPLFLFLSGVIRPYADAFRWLIAKILPSKFNPSRPAMPTTKRELKTKTTGISMIGNWLAIESEFGKTAKSRARTKKYRPESTWQLNFKSHGLTPATDASPPGAISTQPEGTVTSYAPTDHDTSDALMSNFYRMVMLECQFEGKQAEIQSRLRKLVPFDENVVVSRREKHSIFQHYNMWSCVRFTLGTGILICLAIFVPGYRSLELTDHASGKPQILPDAPVDLSSFISSKVCGWASLGFLTTYYLTMQGTVKKSILRIIGVVLGTFSAFLALTWFPTNPYLHCVWYCLWDFIVVWFGADSRNPISGFNTSWGYSAQVFTYQQAVIMSEAFYGQASRDEIVLDRFAGQAIGIGTAVAVSVLFIPCECNSAIRVHLSDSLYCASENLLSLAEVLLPSIDVFCPECAQYKGAELRALASPTRPELDMPDHECLRLQHKEAWLQYNTAVQKRLTYHLGQIAQIVKDASIFVEFPWLRVSKNLLAIQAVVERMNYVHMEATELMARADESIAALYIAFLNERKVSFLTSSPGDVEHASHADRETHRVTVHSRPPSWQRTISPSVVTGNSPTDDSSIWSDGVFEDETSPNLSGDQRFEDEATHGSEPVKNLRQPVKAPRDSAVAASMWKTVYPKEQKARRDTSIVSPATSGSRRCSRDRIEIVRYWDLAVQELTLDRADEPIVGADNPISSASPSPDDDSFPQPREQPTPIAPVVISPPLKSFSSLENQESLKEMVVRSTSMSSLAARQKKSVVMLEPLSKTVSRLSTRISRIESLKIPSGVNENQVVLDEHGEHVTALLKSVRDELARGHMEESLITLMCVISREIVMVLDKLSVLYQWVLDHVGPGKKRQKEAQLTEGDFARWVDEALNYCSSRLNILGAMSAAGNSVLIAEDELQSSRVMSHVVNQPVEPMSPDSIIDNLEISLTFRRVHLFAHFCVQEVSEFRILGASIRAEAWGGE